MSAMDQGILLCSGYLHRHQISGYKDIALIVSKYIDLNRLKIQVCNAYACSFTNAKWIQFYFQSQVTLSNIQKAIIKEFKLDADKTKNKSNNLKIFLECGEELQESNINKLTNNGLLLIVNDSYSDSDTIATQYSQYAKSYYGVQNSAAAFNYDNLGKQTRVPIYMFGSRVGKTCLAERYVFGRFQDEYEPTHGESYGKRINFDNRWSDNILGRSAVFMDIYPCDSYLIEEISDVIEEIVHERDAIIFVFSIDDKKSIDKLNYIYTKFVEAFKQEKLTETIERPPLFLVGNKVDLRDQLNSNSNTNCNHFLVEFEQGLKLMKKYDAVRYIETSAKTNYNVNKLFVSVARCVDNRKFAQFVKKQQPNISGSLNGKPKGCQIL